MSQSPKKTGKWLLPADIMKLHKLKLKKKALQARINNSVKKPCGATPDKSLGADRTSAFDDVLAAKKRKNPFIKKSDSCHNDSATSDSSKRCKIDVTDNDSCLTGDQTLFRILNNSVSSGIAENDSFASLNFKNLLGQLDKNKENHSAPCNTDSAVTSAGKVEIVKAAGEKWPPVDWTLKTKVRLLASKPFPWSSKLKINEEASGVTAFVRSLASSATLDNSPNAKFHQCCLYWQQPALPWLPLFPRSGARIAKQTAAPIGNFNMAGSAAVRDSLQLAFGDSLRSLFQLLRTRQCPYFYACANTFTVLFRAAGIAGSADLHAIVTPSTRGFRQLLKQEDIEYSMPLKSKSRLADRDSGYETFDSDINNADEVKICENEKSAKSDNVEKSAGNADDDEINEAWLKSLGCNPEDIKQINRNQAKIAHKTECEIDNTEQSLVLIEGIEVHGFYNFLLNCKSTTATTGPFAGVPPTLLAPVAFQGATLNSLKVRENRAHLEGADYYSLELIGPILPSLVHNLFSINAPDFSLTATFHNLQGTEAFSKLSRNKGEEPEGTASLVFGTENLSDCGLNSHVLRRFCMPDERATNVDCLKYDSVSGTYSWT